MKPGGQDTPLKPNSAMLSVPVHPLKLMYQETLGPVVYGGMEKFCMVLRPLLRLNTAIICSGAEGPALDTA